MSPRGLDAEHIRALEKHHEDEIDSDSLSLDSDTGTASEKLNFLSTEKMLAICWTTLWTATLEGMTDLGRLGRHLGRNSSLHEVGIYRLNTAWQNINLQKTWAKKME